MNEVIKLYKELGETPLECIGRFRIEHPEYEEVKMTYLGRLDPMAEGLMLVLAGNTKEKEKYLSLDKTYEFEVLWGFETDTYDTLGLVTSGHFPHKIEEKMGRLVEEMLEKKTQKYPPFSSKSFRGNFLKARGEIAELDTEERKIKIFDLKHIHTRLISGSEIFSEISRRITLVNGDFRQEEILERWSKELEQRRVEKFLLSKFSADVSSGTYIRSLAHEMGQKLGSSALAWSIKRTRVGEYLL